MYCINRETCRLLYVHSTEEQIMNVEVLYNKYKTLFQYGSVLLHRSDNVNKVCVEWWGIETTNPFSFVNVVKL